MEDNMVEIKLAKEDLKKQISENTEVPLETVDKVVENFIEVYLKRFKLI